jgi:hypothetical protein
MRYLTLGVIAWCLAGATASAQASNPQVMAPIQKFLDSFNKGDTAAAAATHLADADLTIIDEVAPYTWHGAKAFQTWGAALDADGKARKITEPMVVISAPTRMELSGDTAYVVVPAAYTFKLAGAAMRENAQMTFALKKVAAGWLIHAWTWTGPKPIAAGK